MKTMRVLHEVVMMDPGGIETLLMNLYRHIDREKIQFDFLVHRPDEAFYDKDILNMGGKIYRTAKFSPFPGQYQQHMNDIETVLRAHPEYKVFHAHAELNLWPLMVAKKVGIPTRIAHSHNAKTTLNLKYFFFLYEKMKIKDYCTDMFMCSTPAGIWSFGKDAVESGKVQFIKNGIETERFAYSEKIRMEKRSELGIQDQFVVGHVGRFMQQKNHDFLIDIFKEIHGRRPDSVLILVSDGRLMDNIKAKVHAMGLDDAVRFLGNRRDVNEIYQAMDVFLFPSLWEGLPLTGIEAQTAGLPMVMSDVITEEVCVTPNVYTMSLKDNASMWAKKVLQITEGYQRHNMRQQVVDSGFDIVTTAQFLQEFYLERSLKK